MQDEKSKPIGDSRKAPSLPSRAEDIWIGTYTGKMFYPFAPRVEDVDIEDIAHSLAHQCRFNGHCTRFYSVAEHSVHCSEVLPAEYALWGLMHDAAETYIGDVVRPLKKSAMFGEDAFSDIEDGILYAIAMRFGLPQPVPQEVDWADLRMLATEREQLIDKRMPNWGDLANALPYEITLPCWHQEIAEHKFLKRFEELMKNGGWGLGETNH